MRQNDVLIRFIVCLFLMIYQDFLAAGNDNAARVGGGAAAVEGVARGGGEGGPLRRERSGQSRRRVVAVKHLGTRERQSFGSRRSYLR